MSFVSSAEHEASEEYDERHIGFLFETFGALFAPLMILEFEDGTHILCLIVIEGHQEERVKHPCHRHWQGNYTVRQTARHDLTVGWLALGVLIRKHLETCSLVVVLVLVKDAVKVRELPREYVTCEEPCLQAPNTSGLRHSSDERGKTADNCPDESIPLALLLHGYIDTQVTEPNCVRDEPCVWSELSVSHEWNYRQTCTNEATMLGRDVALRNRPIFRPQHQCIFIWLYDLPKTLGWHCNGLGSKKEGQRREKTHGCERGIIVKHCVRSDCI